MKKLLQRGVGTLNEACGVRFNTSRPWGGGGHTVGDYLQLFFHTPSPHLQDHLLDVTRSDVLGYRQQELVQHLPASEPETHKEER